MFNRQLTLIGCSVQQIKKSRNRKGKTLEPIPLVSMISPIYCSFSFLSLLLSSDIPLTTIHYIVQSGVRKTLLHEKSLCICSAESSGFPLTDTDTGSPVSSVACDTQISHNTLTFQVTLDFLLRYDYSQIFKFYFLQSRKNEKPWRYDEWQCVWMCMCCVFLRVSLFFCQRWLWIDPANQPVSMQTYCRVFTLFNFNLLKYENVCGKQSEFT